MSNHRNERREEERRTEHGSRWENSENDRNSSRGRKKWKTIGRRSERRTGERTPKVHTIGQGRPKCRPCLNPTS